MSTPRPSGRTATPRRRCAALGCTNDTRSAAGYCPAHTTESARQRDGGSARGADPLTDFPTSRAPSGHTDSFAERTAREDRERRQAAAAEFRARLEAGDYRGLFGPSLNELMIQAAAENGVDDEIAILRIVMARLLAEEDDPVTLATAISRVAAVSIQAARARRAITGKLAEGLTDAMTNILTDLGVGGSTR
jgi:hypothetical protein